MKFIKFLLAGIFFGFILVKSEVISWYRIFEMFHFDSFYMYGIIGTAVILGIISVYVIKIMKIKDTCGEYITYPNKNRSVSRYLIGGTIFGLGWAMSGACPGPMFALLGAGIFPIVLVIFGSLIGTYLYGLFRNKLPH